MDSIKALLSKS